jgi:hypothetical protein
MQDFLSWTIETIREDKATWLDKRRNDWTPLCASAVSSIISGYTVIVMTDQDREWFLKYLISKINHPSQNRPFLPFIDFKSMFPAIEYLRTDEEQEFAKDTLDITFPNGYFFWYIGKSEDRRSKLAKSKDDSFLWALDEEVQNGFYLSSIDDKLDIKLIELYTLLNKTINAALFNQISIEL